MKKAGKIPSTIDFITRLFGIAVVVLLIFMMLWVSFGVVTRYFVKRSPVWLIEVTEYCLLYITFLGAAWLVKREGHVKMDLVLNQFSPKIQALLNTLTSALCALVSLIIAWYGAKVAWDHYQTGYHLSTMLRPPSFLLISVIPVGCFMLFLQFLRKTLNTLKAFSAHCRGRGRDFVPDERRA